MSGPLRTKHPFLGGRVKISKPYQFYGTRATVVNIFVTAQLLPSNERESGCNWAPAAASTSWLPSHHLICLSALQRKTNIEAKVKAAPLLPIATLLLPSDNLSANREHFATMAFFARKESGNCFCNSLIALSQTHCWPFVCCTICTFTKTFIWNWAFSLQPLPV